MSDDQIQQQSGENSVIFIGAKPVMNYVLAVLTQFNKEVSDVTLKPEDVPYPELWTLQRLPETGSCRT
jgi:hypothetical protein